MQLFKLTSDIKFIRKWAKALMSGKYNQGKFCLKQTNKKGEVQYCCLGVAAELKKAEFKPASKALLKNISGIPSTHQAYMVGGNSEGKLPQYLEKEIGISADAQDYFADMNDFGNMNFYEIGENILENIRDL